MKPFVFLILIAVITSCTTTAPTKRPSASARSNPHFDIAQLLRASAAGWNNGNIDLFLTMYADHATFAREADFVTGKIAIAQLFLPDFAPDAKRPTMAFEDIDITSLGPDAALVRALTHQKNGRKTVFLGTTTLIFHRIESKWRVIHDHSF